MSKTFLILTIIFLAFLLRIVDISDLPPSLNWDEVSHGYNAYSILKTGRDEWGTFMPTIFRAFGDYKLPVYIYLTAISEFFFGLGPLAVRLPSVIAGAVTVLFTYLLTEELFKNSQLKISNSKLKIASAVLIAVAPWSLFLSRIALEANLAVAFITAGFYFFLRGLRDAKYQLLSAVLLGISVWTYNSARVFVPLLLVAGLLIYRSYLLPARNRHALALAGGLIAIFFVPMFLQLLNAQGQARYGNVRIIDQGAVAEIEELRNKNDFPKIFERAVFNRPVFFVGRFVQNYISHFSPGFLFINGGADFQFSLPGHGLLYPVEVVPFYFGLVIFILKSRKQKEFRFALAWIALAPIASSITREAPHVLRNIVVLPMPMVLSAFGILYLLRLLKSRPHKLLVGGVYGILLTAFFIRYLVAYAGEYRVNFSRAWQFGYKEAVSFTKENYHNYDKIIFSKKYGEPHEFVLFYWPWTPVSYQNDPNLVRFFQSDWYWVDSFDKFYFVNDWQIPQKGTEFVLESGGQFDCVNCLLVTSPGNAPAEFSKIETINFLDGTTAFEVYTQNTLVRN